MIELVTQSKRKANQGCYVAVACYLDASRQRYLRSMAHKWWILFLKPLIFLFRSSVFFWYLRLLFSNPRLRLRSFSPRINDASSLLTYFLLGEIDIMEARGNGPSYPNQYVTFFFSLPTFLKVIPPRTVSLIYFSLTHIGEPITFAGRWIGDL